MAAAVLETEDGLYYVDGDGERIARLEPGDSPAALLRVAAGATAIGISPALATSESSSVRHALAIEASLNGSTGPEWRLPVLWVEVIGDDDYRVYLGALPFPILVRTQEVARRIDLLEQLRPAILERAPLLSEVDLRFESRVIVRPATEEIVAAAAAAKRAQTRGADDPSAVDGPQSDAPMQSTRSSVWDPQPKET